MHRYFSLLMILGFILSPGPSFACKHHSAQNKPLKTISAQVNAQHSCCKAAAGTHGCNTHKQGKCGGACCQCITAGLHKFLPLTVFESNALPFVPAAKKSVFGYAEFFIGTPAKGLRLPPKIS